MSADSAEIVNLNLFTRSRQDVSDHLSRNKENIPSVLEFHLMYTAVMKCFALAAAFLLSMSTAYAQQNSEASQPSYSHDAKGLENQLEPALQAYTAGKLPDVDKQFSRFVFPDAEAWFAQYFPKDRVQELVKRQAKAEDDWETGLTALMSFFPKSTKFHVHCTPSPTKTPQATQTSDSVVLPTTPPPIETYMVEFSADKPSALGMQSFASVALLIYSDGAYRFVGDQDGPFWSAPQKQGNNNP